MSEFETIVVKLNQLKGVILEVERRKRVCWYFVCGKSRRKSVAGTKGLRPVPSLEIGLFHFKWEICISITIAPRPFWEGPQDTACLTGSLLAQKDGDVISSSSRIPVAPASRVAEMPNRTRG